MMPPSAAPISNRVASMKAKPVASPEPNEQSAKSAVESISKLLRDPNRSATTPTPNAAIAQVRQTARQNAHFGVAELKLWLDEGHQEAQCVAIEQDESEAHAEQCGQSPLVGSRRGGPFDRQRAHLINRDNWHGCPKAR